jgi:hypothetical protein
VEPARQEYGRALGDLSSRVKLQRFRTWGLLPGDSFTCRLVSGWALLVSVRAGWALEFLGTLRLVRAFIDLVRWVFVRQSAVGSGYSCISVVEKEAKKLERLEDQGRGAI